MFTKKREIFRGEEALIIDTHSHYDIKDTFDCGQCFRHERVVDEDGYVEYATVIYDMILRVGQRERGELILYGVGDEDFDTTVAPYLSLYTDYEEIREDILSRTDSKWLRDAAECARGIAILKQDKWETLFSFIVCQNNNIPRIKKIIRRVCSEYGVNICLQNGIKKCPFNKISATPCEEICRECGCCYTFPSAEDIHENPSKLESANTGFRYKYLCDAARRVSLKESDLEQIASCRSYTYTVERLKEILGVGDKVASCVALFAFENLEAFPIDVWMKRAIDTYFDGKLDPATLGRYAGVAQQYIFHYIRNIENK